MESNIPTKETIAYTAGFIDADGTVTQLYGKLYKERKSRYRVQISQAHSNNGREICEWFAEVWGIGKVYDQTGLCDISIWNVTRINDIELLLTHCLPYMRVKRQRAEELLEYISGRTPYRRGIWTAPELSIIRNESTASTRELSKRLSRSPDAIRAKRRELGIARPDWHTRKHSIRYRPK